MFELTDAAAEALSRTEVPAHWNAEQHTEPMAAPRLRSLFECLGEVPECRHDRGKRYPLNTILALAVAARLRLPRKIDGRRRRRRGYCHGNAPDVGFRDTASYRFWRCGAFPPSPARPCRRDKILPWSGPLSRIADFGRSSRHKKRTKSMT